MNITIQPAAPADAAAVIAYLKQVGGETDNLTFGGEGLPITEEREAAYLAGLQNSSDSIMLLAKVDGQIVADASLSRLPRRMSHRGDLGIAVVKEYWNRGIGGMLLDKLIDFAKEKDFEIIDLQVRSDNLGAIHLYEKYGFEKLCTYPAFFKIEDQYVDFDYMCLRLK